MEQLQVFTNETFGRVRTMQEEGKVLFCGTDIAKALGYSNPRDALARHCKGVVKRDTPTDSGTQPINFIPEGDVYRLIVHSKLPGAERFEAWVFDEVLPNIRTGEYRKMPAVDMEALTAVITQTATLVCREMIKQLRPLLREGFSGDYVYLTESAASARRRRRPASIISKLDISLREAVEAMIEDNRYTYRDIQDFLERQGVKLSISAIGAYAKQLYETR